MESALPDVNHIINDDPARQAFKCFNKFKISKDIDATALHIIWLDAVITATVEILKRNLTGKDRYGTK